MGGAVGRISRSSTPVLIVADLFHPSASACPVWVRLSLLLERTHLVECRQPVLAVPSPDNPSVLEFMDINGLDGHFPVLRRKAHERRSMRAGELRTHDDLVSV